MGTTQAWVNAFFYTVYLAVAVVAVLVCFSTGQLDFWHGIFVTEETLYLDAVAMGFVQGGGDHSASSYHDNNFTIGRECQFLDPDTGMRLAQSHLCSINNKHARTSTHSFKCLNALKSYDDGTRVWGVGETMRVKNSTLLKRVLANSGTRIIRLECDIFVWACCYRLVGQVAHSSTNRHSHIQTYQPPL